MTDRLERSDRLAAAVDRRHGQWLRVEPQTRAVGLGRPASDPERPAFEVIGTLSLGTGIADLAGWGEGDFQIAVPAGSIVASIRRRALAELGVSFELRAGDRVSALDLPDQPSFEISKFSNGGNPARLSFSMVRRGEA